MAKYFSEDDINEFKECFSLFARRGYISRPEELTIIMRSLGYSPTKTEVAQYMSKNMRDGAIEFDSFLDIMHVHSEQERCLEDILAAFKALDTQKTGIITAVDLRGILQSFGEKMSSHEVDRLFEEAGIQNNGRVRYDDLVRFLMKPIA